MDFDLLRRNGAAIGSYDYRVTGDSFFNGPVELHIRSIGSAHLKVSAVLRKKLNLSRKELEEKISDGRIQSKTGQDIMRCRMTDEIVLIVL